MAEHVDINCSACGVEFCMPRSLYNARREDGGSFHCPNGHSLSYRPTEQEKRTKALEEQLVERDAFGRRQSEWLDEAWSGREEAIGAMKECPLGCGFRSRRQVPRDPVSMGRGIERVRGDLIEHLVEDHGARAEPIKQIPMRTGEAR